MTGKTYYPVFHMAPIPRQDGHSWQNDGQNYVWDRKEEVWRTWALGNPEWNPDSGFPTTSWISYKGDGITSMRPEEDVFIDKNSSIGGTLWSGCAYVDWDDKLGRGPGSVYYYVSGLTPSLQGITVFVADCLGETPYSLGMCCPPDIVPESQRDGGRDFRDCRVFYDNHNSQLVMAATIGTRFLFLRSLDGVRWEPLSTTEGPGPLVECPNVMKLPVHDKEGEPTGESKYAILGAVQGQYRGSTDSNESCVAWIGSWDGFRFTPDEDMPVPLDYGPDSYATVAGDKDGCNFFGFWLGNWAYCLLPMPYKGFTNIQGFPRECWIGTEQDGRQRVFSMPVSLPDHRIESCVDFEPTTITADSPFTVCPQGTSYVMDLSLHQDGGEWPGKISLNLCQGTVAGVDYGTTITISRDGEVIFDRSHSGNEYPGSPGRAPDEWVKTYTIPADRKVTAGKKIDLKVLVDQSSIELFVNNGKCSLSALVFPPEGCSGISVESSHEVRVAASLFTVK